MPFRLRPAAAAGALVAALVLPSAALAADGHPSNLRCSGSYTGGTYANVTVPSNDACYLTDATVLGDVTVGGSSAYASLTDTTVFGNATVGTDGSEIDLNTSADNGPVASSPMTVHGNLTVGDIGYAYVNPGAMVDGTSVLNSAESYQVTQATVHNIVSQDASGLYLYEADVDGNILSNDAQSGGSITDNTIRGNIVINGTQSGAYSSWFINGPPQEIDGNVILTNNQEPIFIFGNHIRQNLACTGNNPPPSGNGGTNQVDGRSLGQCATIPTGTVDGGSSAS